MTIKFFAKLLIAAALFSSVIADAQNNWVKHPAPVLTRSATFPHWTGLATGDAFTMRDGDTLKMWYSGAGWLASTDDCPHVRIGYAWSLDGTTWKEHPNNPVLNISSNPADFDYDGVETPTVIKDLTASANQRYKLWYAGRKSRCLPGNDHKLGYAYSPDGINWTKYTGNPVLAAGDRTNWFNTFISSPSVLLDNGVYKMWFTAPDLVINNQQTDGKGNIGYATSSNGITWAVHPSPVLIAGEQANRDSASIAEPSVMKVGNRYHMFYSALDRWAVENFQAGYAVSSDGINWTKSTQNPVLRIGSAAKWDKYWASHPGVIYDTRDFKFKMWYTGRDTANITGLTGYYWDIGYAESIHTPGTGEGNNSLFIYPNPANNKLNIQLLFNINNGTIKIYSQTGQVIKTISQIKSQNISIDISDLANGIYFLTVQHDSKQLNRKLVVIR